MHLEMNGKLSRKALSGAIAVALTLAATSVLANSQSGE
jgi:hypothetical protein